ncbi:hypothetical protein Acr_00g0064270 [Actinidia rufa]|uniref:Uncharacterized protein n=1 Tax=Actinidia rufa TaxID=165716 RepID=A0A7J0DPN9_9ERIC|nr:hypothetical protein Acr_00g0064270 [Actinidia rufa]
MMASQSDSHSDSRENQGEVPHAPRTLGDRGVKLLADAQRTAKATSKQRLVQLLLQGRDSRDITFKRLQAQLTEMTQILVDNILMKSAQATEGGPYEGRVSLHRAHSSVDLRETLNAKRNREGDLRAKLNNQRTVSPVKTIILTKSIAYAAISIPREPIPRWYHGGISFARNYSHDMGANHPNLKNRIQGEIRIVRQMYEVISVQPMAKKLKQTVSELENITFSKADLQRVQRPHTDSLVIQLRINNYDVKRILVDTESSIEAAMKEVQLVEEELKVLEDVGMNLEAKVVEDPIHYELDELSSDCFFLTSANLKERERTELI